MRQFCLEHRLPFKSSDLGVRGLSACLPDSLPLFLGIAEWARPTQPAFWWEKTVTAGLRRERGLLLVVVL